MLRSSGEEGNDHSNAVGPRPPFTVSIPGAEIDDLKRRLARTRWLDPETVGDCSQGVRVENARSLAGYWQRGYDWRRFESGLNRFPSS